MLSGAVIFLATCVSRWRCDCYIFQKSRSFFEHLTFKEKLKEFVFFLQLILQICEPTIFSFVSWNVL